LGFEDSKLGIEPEGLELEDSSAVAKMSDVNPPMLVVIVVAGLGKAIDELVEAAEELNVLLPVALEAAVFVCVLVEVVVVVVSSSVAVVPEVNAVVTGLAGSTAGHGNIKLDHHSTTYTGGMRSILIGIGH
jgi:hypothetical protein